MYRKALLAALAASGLLAGAACAPISAYQGYQAIDQRPGDVKVGVDNLTTVRTKLGTPTAVSTFDKNVWFYIDQVRSQTSFYHPKVARRDVVAIAFDHDTEQVTAVNTYGLRDGRVIAYNTHETPTRGREMTILEQLIGSISNGSALPRDQDLTPGSHPDDRH